jgi:O-antigen/teichoic acid export membrane protein
LREARGSVLLSFSTTTQTGLQPYVTAALSSAVVSIAVPGRTLANGARTLSTAIGSVAFVSVAARFAELPDARARYELWVRNAPILSVVQLGGVTALLGLAPVVVPYWLPHQSAAILQLLPFYCVEQGAFAASVPVIILAQAVGRFGALGGVTLAASVVSITATLVLVPTYGAVGFAGANAAAAALVLVPCLIAWEWRYWREVGVSAGSSMIMRCGMVVAALAVAVVEWRSRSWGIVCCFTLLAIVGVNAFRRRRRPSASAG